MEEKEIERKNNKMDREREEFYGKRKGRKKI